MTTQLTRVQAGGTIEAGAADANPAQEGTARAIAAAVTAVRETMETIGGLTEQLGTLTTQLTRVTANTEGQTIEIEEARDAIDEIMTAIGELKGAEGLSDTVVDAIGILENAWAELGEVELGTGNNGAGTAVGAITAEATAIENVTQEQVGILKEARGIDYTVNYSTSRRKYSSSRR